MKESENDSKRLKSGYLDYCPEGTGCAKCVLGIIGDRKGQRNKEEVSVGRRGQEVMEASQSK